MEEAEKRVAAVLRSDSDVSCQDPSVSHNERAAILRHRRYTAESCAAHLFPQTAHVRVMDRSTRYALQIRLVACASPGDHLAAFAVLCDAEPVEVYERQSINSRESTSVSSLQTCMYTCTLLFVHDRYRDSATLMIAHKSNDTFVRPLKARIGADTLSPVTSLKDPSQTSLFKERRLEDQNHSRPREDRRSHQKRAWRL
jgi:hypothetical protein